MAKGIVLPGDYVEMRYSDAESYGAGDGGLHWKDLAMTVGTFAGFIGQCYVGDRLFNRRAATMTPNDDVSSMYNNNSRKQSFVPQDDNTSALDCSFSSNQSRDFSQMSEGSIQSKVTIKLPE